MILSVACTKKTGIKQQRAYLRTVKQQHSPATYSQLLGTYLRKVLAESRQKKWQQIGRIVRQMMATYGMFKLVLMGDLGVGKTCIHHRIVGEDAPNNSTVSKIGTFLIDVENLNSPQNNSQTDLYHAISLCHWQCIILDSSFD